MKRAGRHASRPVQIGPATSQRSAPAPEAASSTAAALAAAVLRLVHAQVPAAKLGAVERLDRVLRRARVPHLDETEAARAAGLAIRDHADGAHVTVLLEQRAELVLACGEREVSDV